MTCCHGVGRRPPLLNFPKSEIAKNEFRMFSIESDRWVNEFKPLMLRYSQYRNVSWITQKPHACVMLIVSGAVRLKYLRRARDGTNRAVHRWYASSGQSGRFRVEHMKMPVDGGPHTI
jgi:hypothetical protein